MMRHPLIKTFMVLTAALFLAAQGFSQSHAASNGGHDHSHDGVACDVALVAAEQTVLTPPPPSPAPFALVTRPTKSQLREEPAYRSFDGRAPPPRGPPL